MGCFLACFYAPKHPKSLKPPNYEVLSENQRVEIQGVLQPNQPIEQEKLEIHMSSITESHDEKQEGLQSNNIEEKVTFDLDMKSHEEFSTQEIPNSPHHDQLVIEESSESLFSLSIDSRKQQGSEAEIGEKEVNSPITIQHVHSVLNQVDNLIPQKAIKEKTMPPLKLDQEKENINIEQELNIPFSEEPLLLIHKSKEGKIEEKEIAVETSLSSWLVDSETPPSIAKKSPISIGSSLQKSSRRFEDRPILGELNFEGVK